MQRVFNRSTERLMFTAWAGLAAEARRTREYFEVSTLPTPLPTPLLPTYTTLD